jgi:D-cysteine desulfhydrase
MNLSSSTLTSVAYPSRLQLAQTPTPLQKLSRVSSELGGPTIWLKRDDLTGSLLSGNKVRKLEFTLAQAQSEGADTLITCGGLQSNHCRATALLGAQLGLDVHLILRGELPAISEGNLLLDQLAGATISTYKPNEYAKRLNELLRTAAEGYEQEGGKPFVIPTGASDDIGVWGYVRACEELQQDFAQHGLEPTHIIAATGSGGTQAGLTAGAHLFNLSAEVLGMAVCDDEAYFQHKVMQDLKGWQRRYGVEIDLQKLNVSVNDRYIGPGYAKAEKPVFDCIKWLASTEGVVLDPVYTGKAFYGLVSDIQAGKYDKNTDVVFVHTGGIFGVFPQREQFYS